MQQSPLNVQLFAGHYTSGIGSGLTGHEVTEAIERGWDRISNGELLKVAEAAGFDVLLTTDKGIRYQQNLTGRKIAIVVLGNSTWRILRLYLDRVAFAVADATPGSYAEVDIPFRQAYPRDRPRLAPSQRMREMGPPASEVGAIGEGLTILSPCLSILVLERQAPFNGKSAACHVAPRPPNSPTPVPP